MYGDSRENMLEILAVVIILSRISSVCSAAQPLRRIGGEALSNNLQRQASQQPPQPPSTCLQQTSRKAQRGGGGHLGLGIMERAIKFLFERQLVHLELFVATFPGVTLFLERTQHSSLSRPVLLGLFQVIFYGAPFSRGVPCLFCLPSPPHPAVSVTRSHASTQAKHLPSSPCGAMRRNLT